MPTDEQIRFRCSKADCRKSLKAPMNLQGKTCRCSRCGVSLDVPTTDALISDQPTEVNVELVPDAPVPPPFPLPAFDFKPEPAPAPRYQRPDQKGSPLTGLFIALLVLVALGVGIGGWFLWVSAKNERDKQRLVEIESEIETLVRRLIKEVALDAIVNGLKEFARQVKGGKYNADFDRPFGFPMEERAKDAIEDALRKRVNQADALGLIKRAELIEREYDEIKARHPDWHPNPTRLEKRIDKVVMDFVSQMRSISDELGRQRKNPSAPLLPAEVDARINALIRELQARHRDW